MSGKQLHQLGMNIVDFVDDNDSGVIHGVLLVLRGNMTVGNDVAGISHLVSERHGVSSFSRFMNLCSCKLAFG